MLRLLSGKSHHVISGIALLMGEREATAAESTSVRFAEMTEEEILSYVASCEPRDKAGAYAVQGLASLYIEGLCGDYFNVVGLPIHRLNVLLREFADRTLLQLS